jgi:hypothetical protein
MATTWQDALLGGLGVAAKAAQGAPSAANLGLTGSNNPNFGTDWNVNFSGTQTNTKKDSGELLGAGAAKGLPMWLVLVAIGAGVFVWIKKKQ